MLKRKTIQNIFYLYILAAGVLWGTIGLFLIGSAIWGWTGFRSCCCALALRQSVWGYTLP